MLQSGWPPEIDIMEFPLSDTSQAHNETYRYWWNYHWGTVSDHRSAGSEEWVASDLTQELVSKGAIPQTDLGDAGDRDHADLD